MAVDVFEAATGTNQYVNLIDPITGGWYNTVSLGYEAFTPANFTQYAIAATEYGTTGLFEYTVPSGLPTGSHNAVSRTRAGGSAAQSDANGAAGLLRWTGTAVEYQSGDTYSRIGVTGGLATPVVRAGTVQFSTTVSLQLDAGASSTNNIYNGLLIHIISGTGAGQVRTVTSYNGNTKSCVLDRPFQTAPNSASTFELLAADGPSVNANLAVTANIPVVVIRSGTAQGGTATIIRLDAGASATSSLYNNDLITITGGAGAGQTRTIIQYDGSTKFAGVDRPWITTPNNTSTFDIYASTTPTLYSDQGFAQAGSATTITLQSTASASNDIYNGSIVTILAGTGAGQTREITDYVGGTKVVTVDTAWAVDPDSQSTYAVIPTASGTGSSGGTSDVNVVSWAGEGVGTLPTNFSVLAIDSLGQVTVGTNNDKTGYSLTITPPTAAEISDGVWDELLSGHTTPGSAGEYLISAGGSGDPWATMLPGSYTVGTAGYYLDARISDIKAKTDQLTFTIPLQVDANALTGGGGSDPLTNQVPDGYAQGSAGWALGQLASGQVETVSAVSQSGDITLIRGDAYTAAHGQALDWTNSDGDWPNLSEAIITLEIIDEDFSIIGSCLNPGASFQTARAEPLGADTLLLGVGEYEFAVVATFLGTGTSAGRSDRVTIIRGKCIVEARE